jgi:hypothetical protein
VWQCIEELEIAPSSLRELPEFLVRIVQEEALAGKHVAYRFLWRLADEKLGLHASKLHRAQEWVDVVNEIERYKPVTIFTSSVKKERTGVAREIRRGLEACGVNPDNLHHLERFIKVFELLMTQWLGSPARRNRT